MRGKLKQPPMPAGSGGVRMRAHLGSLRARLVLYVFCIMTMASLFTSAAYVVMLSAGWLRDNIQKPLLDRLERRLIV